MPAAVTFNTAQHYYSILNYGERFIHLLLKTDRMQQGRQFADLLIKKFSFSTGIQQRSTGKMFSAH
jgi:hypothetical protein